MRRRHPLARYVTAVPGGACSEVPEARGFRLRGVQDRIAASNERIEPVRLGLGPLDPLLLRGRELIVVARSILDGGDELAHLVCALQPARVAEQGAQLATFLVARAYLRFVSGARFLVGIDPSRQPDGIGLGIPPEPGIIIPEVVEVEVGRGPPGSGGCIKPLGQRRVLGDHGLDFRQVAGVQVSAEVSQFALLGLDLGQPAGIGVYSVKRRCRRFGPVGEQCAQNASWAASRRIPLVNCVGISDLRPSP